MPLVLFFDLPFPSIWLRIDQSTINMLPPFQPRTSGDLPLLCSNWTNIPFRVILYLPVRFRQYPFPLGTYSHFLFRYSTVATTGSSVGPIRHNSFRQQPTLSWPRQVDSPERFSHSCILLQGPFHLHTFSASLPFLSSPSTNQRVAHSSFYPFGGELHQSQ